MTRRKILGADASSIVKIVQEINVGNLREEAFDTPRLALIGSPENTGRLLAQLQRGPHATGHTVTAAPTFRLPQTAEQALALAGYDLRVLLLDSQEQLALAGVQALAAQPAPLLAVLDVAPGSGDAVAAPRDFDPAAPQPPISLMACPLADEAAVQEALLPALAGRLAGREIALARAYPGLRPVASQRLVRETSVTNATYAFTTGVGELVPLLAIPLTVADIIVLTKNQILLSYKIALLMGESEELRQVAPKLMAVVGFGFIWRQLARELVGLVPGIGLIPKVAVAYAGTYATGQAVYHWFATGEKLQEGELRAAFVAALEQGREFAESVGARARSRRQLRGERKARSPRRRLALRKPGRLTLRRRQPADGEGGP